MALDRKKKMILAGIALLFIIVIGASFLMPKGEETEYDPEEDQIETEETQVETEEAQVETEGTGETAETEPEPVEEIPQSKKMPISEPAPIISIDKKKTTASHDGAGNTVYLDRHSLDCGQKSIMNQFHMNREKGNTGQYDQVQYNYTCITGREGNMTTKNTGANEDGGGNNIYLDRHTVNCEDKFVNQFKLTRPSDNTIQYDYKCIDTPVDMDTCRTDRISPQEDGGGNIIYLDRQNVKCNDDEGLTKFRLTRPTNNTIAYEYTCCKPK